MKVGSRVRFVGPAYKWNTIPVAGQLGTVTESRGFTCGVSGTPVELVTVQFDGVRKETVVSVNRIEQVDADK